MPKYSSYPKGILLGPKHVITDKSQIKNIDFVAIDCGDGWATSPNFTSLLDTVYHLGLPVIGYFHVSMEQYQALVNGFPEAKSDWNIQNLARMLLMGLKFESEGATLVVDENGHVPGTHRVVSSLIFDYTSNIDRNTGNMITAGWVRKISDNFNSVAYKAFRLPQFYYVTQALIDMYPSGNEDIKAWLASLDGFSTWKTATPNNLVTYSASWDNFPVPDDNYSIPSYYKKTAFMKYANTKWMFSGIDGGAVPCLLYNGTKEEFYNDINYTPSTVVPAPPTDPVVDPVDPTPINTNFDDLNAKFATLEASVSALKTSIANLK